jgi:C4-dicarboxylate transporter DctQ subunit
MDSKKGSRISEGLSRVEEYVLSLAVLQMGLSIFLQVIMRYAFQSAITWLDELVHIEVVLLTFFGASLGIKYGAHISVDALKKHIMKEPYRSLIEAFDHLVMAVYAAAMVYFGLGLISAMTKRPHYTPTLRIPKHELYFVVCVALALIALRSSMGFWRAVRKLLSGSAREGNS